MDQREQLRPACAGISSGDEGEISRGDVLLRGALAVGGLYGIGAVAPWVSRALASSGSKDVDTLNYLMPFEYIQASLYNRGKSEINDKGEKMPLQTREKELVDLFLEQEGQHIAAMKKMIEKLGGKPVDKGEYALAFRIFPQFLEIAGTLETTAVGAYNGAIPLLESAEARELAYTIVQVEARHAATVHIGVKEEPAPEAFDHAVAENDAIAHLVPYTDVYPESLQEREEKEQEES